MTTTHISPEPCHQLDRVCPPLPTPGVTIYRSDVACRGQGTIAETLAGWDAAVWSADARVWVLAEIQLPRVISLEMSTPIIIPILFPSSVSCFERFVCRNLTLFCDSLWTFCLAKQLARHLPSVCRS